MIAPGSMPSSPVFSPSPIPTAIPRSSWRGASTSVSPGSGSPRAWADSEWSGACSPSGNSASLRPPHPTRPPSTLWAGPWAGSDMAALAARPVRGGDEWMINGQKVWTTLAHIAKWGMLVCRTDPDVPKHQGMTYFIVDMTAPGVEVRPLRQITGEAEFNEVYFTDARIPDRDRIGEVGDGLRIALNTPMNNAIAIGGNRNPPR